MSGKNRCLKFPRIFISAVLFLGFTACLDFLSGAQAERALWVVRTSLLSRKEIDTMVEMASRGGFNNLFVQVCGRADSYFPSRVYPPAENCRKLLESGFDPLTFLLERAHAREIKVHAWVNTFLIWSSPRKPQNPRHLLNRHPEWMMVDKNGVSHASYPHSRFGKLNITGVFLSPANRRATLLLQEFILDLAARYPIDGVHLDYLRYPSGNVDFSPEARREFKERNGVDPVRLFDRGTERNRTNTEYSELLTRWTDFRAELVTRFVTSLTRSLNELKPGLTRSVAVKPDFRQAYETFGQDWVRWVREGMIDMVLPMAYSTNPDVVYNQISRACREVGPSRVWAGLRAYNVPVSGIIQRARKIQPLAPGGYCFFSYNGMKDNPHFFDRMSRFLTAR